MQALSESLRLASPVRASASGRGDREPARVDAATRSSTSGCDASQPPRRDNLSGSHPAIECTAAELAAAEDSAFGWEHVGACALIAFLLALPTGWLELAAAWLVGALR